MESDPFWAAQEFVFVACCVVHPGHPLGVLIWISAASTGHVLFGKGLWLFQVLGTIPKGEKDL